MTVRAAALASALLLSSCLAGCGSDDGGGGGGASIVDEIAATNVGQYLGTIQPDSSEVNGAWTEYGYDPAKEEAICYTGMPYQVNVRHGSTNKVLLYLEGGGACWNALTCYGVPIAKGSAGSAPNAGILSATTAENPFKDWNVVYAPYCDGSVFGGDNEVDYNARHTFHHGLQNLSAAVTRMLEEFPDPELIVVAGSSAGGFGTYTGYGVTRVAYPDTQILVYDDSGPGIQNLEATEAIQEREENWKFRQFLPESCTRCSEQITYLTEWSLERDPDLRVAYFDYLQDGVLRFFLNVSAEQFESLLRQVTDDIHSRQDERYQRFFKQGPTHTVLLSPEFYTLSIEDTTVRDWTQAFLDDDSEVWRDLVE